MITNFRPFDENGHMKHSGRACAAKRGVVASGRAEASEIGKEILAAGGNAVDAAVAVAFALGVCEPNACGIGGGGFFLIRSAKTGENVFLNFREKAPAAARPDMYERNSSRDLSKGWEGANYDKDLRNVYSAAAAAVPGDVAGLLYALEHYGTLDRSTVNVNNLKETTVFQLKVLKPSDNAVLSNDTVTVTVEIEPEEP